MSTAVRQPWSGPRAVSAATTKVVTVNLDDYEGRVEVYRRLNDVCMERANQLLEQAGEDIRASAIYGQQEHRRKSALARMRACREFVVSLRASVDFELDLAVAAGRVMQR
jgi:hypothetical protein